MKYIKLNLHKNITINEITKQFKMSNSHLCSIKKKEVHITLKQYILEQKISTSKIMIKEDYSMNDIALSLGFSDASHFSRTFKKITGKTPKQFKNSLYTKIICYKRFLFPYLYLVIFSLNIFSISQLVNISLQKYYNILLLYKIYKIKTGKKIILRSLFYIFYCTFSCLVSFLVSLYLIIL